MAKNTSVVTAAGFGFVREAIDARLQETDELVVVGQASDGFYVLKLCRALQPNIMLMDFDLIQPYGIGVLAEINKLRPDTMTVIISPRNSNCVALSSLTKDATSVVPKNATGADVIDAITVEAGGFVYLPENHPQEFVQSNEKAWCATTDPGAPSMKQRLSNIVPIQLLGGISGRQIHPFVPTSSNYRLS